MSILLFAPLPDVHKVKGTQRAVGGNCKNFFSYEAFVFLAKKVFAIVSKGHIGQEQGHGHEKDVGAWFFFILATLKRNRVDFESLLYREKGYEYSDGREKITSPRS